MRLIPRKRIRILCGEHSREKTWHVPQTCLNTTTSLSNPHCAPCASVSVSVSVCARVSVSVRDCVCVCKDVCVRVCVCVYNEEVLPLSGPAINHISLADCFTCTGLSDNKVAPGYRSLHPSCQVILPFFLSLWTFMTFLSLSVTELKQRVRVEVCMRVSLCVCTKTIIENVVTFPSRHQELTHQSLSQPLELLKTSTVWPVPGITLEVYPSCAQTINWKPTLTPTSNTLLTFKKSFGRL